MTVAAIYARKSRITEKGDSIENQIKLCKKYLENINIDNFLIYKDEGFSGKNTDRPEFLRMIKDAKEKKFSVLICYKLDRISRNVADFSNLVTDLDKLGVSFISVNEQFDTSTAMGRAMMFISSVFAQLERETISQRVQDNMMALAENGNWLGGEPPTGYRSERIQYTDNNGKDKTYCILSPIEEEIDLVKLIYSKYLELGSLSKVHKYMLSNNIKTKSGIDWSNATLKVILTNPAYVKADNDIATYFKEQGTNISGDVDGIHGILIYNKRKGKQGGYRNTEDWIYAVSSHEGVIESSDWIKVQRQMGINKTKAPALGSSHIALLSGLIRCAKCNSFMRVAYGKQYADKGIKKYYYACSMKHNSGGTRCNNKNVNGVLLDEMVIQKLREMSIDKNTLISELEEYRSQLENSSESTELKNVTQSIIQRKMMLENLINNLALTSDKDTAEILLKRIGEVREENKQLEMRLQNIKAEAEAQADVIHNCDSFMKLLKNFSLVVDIASVEEKRRLISSIIERVYVNGDTGKVTIKFWGVDGV